MLLAPKQFTAFVDGRGPDRFQIAQTPLDLSSHIRARTNSLLIGREYALKLITAHGLQYKHFALVQTIVDCGWCGLHSEIDRTDLAFVYISDDPHERPLKLVIKTPSSEDEMWVKTLHKMERQQAKKFLKKLDLLRHHEGWNDESAG